MPSRPYQLIVMSRDAGTTYRLVSLFPAALQAIQAGCNGSCKAVMMPHFRGSSWMLVIILVGVHTGELWRNGSLKAFACSLKCATLQDTCLTVIPKLI